VVEKIIHVKHKLAPLILLLLTLITHTY